MQLGLAYTSSLSHEEQEHKVFLRGSFRGPNFRVQVVSTRETVEKPICNLAIIADGVDFGRILFFLELSALS